ncbi:MAG TPA: hypothetical protein PLI43_00980 [Albidovulum sp.]|uniref:hypothetical protein n=1 Tax=Albidovulum sp. TaxID=1872424 RepID=UPI002B82D68C|nr:hypothetical protein [Albidovulum sp.]
MRIIRHTQTQFAAEEKPLHWSGLFAVFAIASLVLLTEALTQGGGWQMVAAALFFAVSGYLLFSADRVWLVLDREINAADMRFGHESMLISVDALMCADVVETGNGYALAITTAIRDVPFLLASRDHDPARLQACATQLNGWLKGQMVTASAAETAPMLDSAPLLT